MASLALAPGHEEQQSAPFGIIPVCMYVYVCVYTCVYVYIYICVYTHTHLLLWVSQTGSGITA